MKMNKKRFLEKDPNEISKRYAELYPGPTPAQCPWMFNPLNPPEGWMWDYENEYWYKHDK
jgi:hypothetical protein